MPTFRESRGASALFPRSSGENSTYHSAFAAKSGGAMTPIGSARRSRRSRGRSRPSRSRMAPMVDGAGQTTSARSLTRRVRIFFGPKCGKALPHRHNGSHRVRFRLLRTAPRRVRSSNHLASPLARRCSHTQNVSRLTPYRAANVLTVKAQVSRSANIRIRSSIEQVSLNGIGTTSRCILTGQESTQSVPSTPYPLSPISPLRLLPQREKLV